MSLPAVFNALAVAIHEATASIHGDSQFMTRRVNSFFTASFIRLPQSLRDSSLREGAKMTKFFTLR